MQTNIVPLIATNNLNEVIKHGEHLLTAVELYDVRKRQTQTYPV